LKQFAQLVEMRLVHFRIEQRPRLGFPEDDRYRRKRELPIVLIFDGGFVVTSRRGVNTDQAYRQHQVLQRLPRRETLRDAALHRGVLDAGKLLNKVPELAADGMHRERYDIVVVGRNRGVEDTGEIVDFLELAVTPSRSYGTRPSPIAWR
jgi:hypothetical protein